MVYTLRCYMKTLALFSPLILPCKSLYIIYVGQCWSVGKYKDSYLIALRCNKAVMIYFHTIDCSHNPWIDSFHEFCTFTINSKRVDVLLVVNYMVLFSQSHTKAMAETLHTVTLQHGQNITRVFAWAKLLSKWTVGIMLMQCIKKLNPLSLLHNYISIFKDWNWQIDLMKIDSLTS